MKVGFPLAAKLLNRNFGLYAIVRQPERLMNRPKAIVDASNVAYLQAPREPRPNIKNISAVADAVEASGRDPIIILDPTIRTLIVDVDEFERLLSDSRIMPLPSGKEIGRFVVETADQLDAEIVSNNTYIDYFEDYPWIELRRIPVAIVNGDIILLDRKLRRAS
jgi:hypothetical protein